MSDPMTASNESGSDAVCGELHEAQDLLKEQRVAGRPGDDRRDVVGAEGSGFGGGVDELLGLPGLQRFEVDGRGRLRREASGAGRRTTTSSHGCSVRLACTTRRAGGRWPRPPSAVLDDEHDRAGHLPGDELDDDVGQAVPRNRGSMASTSGVVSTVMWATSPMNGCIGISGIELGDPPGEERGHRGLIGARDAEQLPDGVQRAVGEVRAVGLATDGPDDDPVVVGEGLGDEPGLADTGVAVDDDRAAVPSACSAASASANTACSASRPVKGSSSPPPVAAAGARLDPELDGVQRHRLALDVERRERHGREEGPRPVDDRQAAVHRARAGGRHEAGGDVHGVAHDRVGGVVAHPDLARRRRGRC